MIGLAVNSTPAATGSTIRCTTTPIRDRVVGDAGGLAVGDRALGSTATSQHRRTASISASAPLTFSTVSCWPAKLACGRSSAVALDRTATGTRPEPLVGRDDLPAQVVIDERRRAPRS